MHSARLPAHTLSHACMHVHAALLPQMRLQAAANAGNTAALLSLADRFFTGLGVPRSPYTALQYANLAARQIAQDVEKVCICRQGRNQWCMRRQASVVCACTDMSQWCACTDKN